MGLPSAGESIGPCGDRTRDLLDAIEARSHCANGPRAFAIHRSRPACWQAGWRSRISLLRTLCRLLLLRRLVRKGRRLSAEDVEVKNLEDAKRIYDEEDDEPVLLAAPRRLPKRHSFTNERPDGDEDKERHEEREKRTERKRPVIVIIRTVGHTVTPVFLISIPTFGCLPDGFCNVTNPRPMA